ncbi:MAG: HD-GYP domain-containing protein, partial [Bacilli bacterium]|nr:HD-GYP domain-containing protein [Bacilli bacterium]
GVFKMRKIAIIFPTLFCGVMFVYYTLTGAASGTAVLWSLIMPIGLCYFVGIRVGIGMSLLYAIFYLVMFYSPLNQYISSYYDPVYFVRFPLFFIASAGFAIIAMIQYHRMALVEIDYAQRLSEEVEAQTKVARERAAMLANITEEVVQTLAHVIDAKDKYTNGHSFRVALYSVALARMFGWNEQELNKLRWEALLHDIGKIGIPDHVLNKPDKLTAAEYEVIRSHTTIGYSILNETADLKSAALTARYHHERYDGKGYPDGIKGDDIPLHARIVSIADAYDAMHSDRIYRKGLSHEEIRKEFENGKGTQFDPVLLESFLELFEEGELDRLEKEHPAPTFLA